MIRRGRRPATPGNGAERTVHMVASILLGYPDERLTDARPILNDAVATLGNGTGETGTGGIGEASRHLAAFLAHLDTTPLPDLAAHYVAVFDLKRRCCPYLTYYTYGDTRRRGMALLRFNHAYRAAGYQPPDGELPDHLAAVCELSGRGATDHAIRLLREHHAGIHVLHQALTAEYSPYAHVVAAVLATLPPPGPRERATALRLAAQGPPAEEVGLDPFSPSGTPFLPPSAPPPPPAPPAPSAPTKGER
ncbi:nitrate reductase molybdenum cofactor assembly chaperone [Microtetraspora niveoalba]|uniref:nitrate reductase molybdenum cofactor assembly chaperone n=1 Tax=Microtetraspora niveoalba TaxID=46175 RepID=UPI00083477C5|nr:nitrate reductase molybdenum cofactor assembly chaperone [Microtetraspora niveoalba]